MGTEESMEQAQSVNRDTRQPALAAILSPGAATIPAGNFADALLTCIAVIFWFVLIIFISGINC